MIGEPSIKAMLFQVCRLHVAAKVAAIHFRDLAGTADGPALQFNRHRFPQLVGEHEGRLVRRAQVAGERQHRLALDLVAEDRNRREVAFQGQLVGGEQRARRDAEILAARLAAEPGRPARAAGAVGIDAAAVRADWLAVVVSPADLAERRFRLFVRHAEHLSEAQGLCCRGKEEVLQGVASDR